MREVKGSFGTVWISSQSREWYDHPIEKMLHTVLPAEPSISGVPLHVGIRKVKWASGPGIHVILGATYSPNNSDTLTIESAVLRVTDAISPGAGEYEAKLNAEFAELILREAANTLERRPVLKAGLLRFDKLHIHPIDSSEYLWQYGTRVLIGLLNIADYEMLSDEDITAKLEEFAKASY